MNWDFLGFGKLGATFSNSTKGLGSLLGSSALGNLATGLSGIGSIINGIGGWQSARKAVKEQKRQNALLEAQFYEEKARYDAYKKQKDEGNALISATAGAYANPTEVRMGSILGNLGSLENLGASEQDA